MGTEGNASPTAPLVRVTALAHVTALVRTVSAALGWHGDSSEGLGGQSVAREGLHLHQPSSMS